MMMGWMACVAIMVFGAGGADTNENGVEITHLLEFHNLLF